MSDWEWVDGEPSIDEVKEKLASLPPVWGVEMVDYIEYVLPMTKNAKIRVDGKQKTVPVTKLYMQVAGRVKMLNDAAEVNGWVVTEKQKLICFDPFVMQIGIEISGTDSAKVAAHGRRYGISKAKGGDNAWEKMETAARGRALGAWGFGILPGSGIASADEMEGVELTPQTREVYQKSRSKEELIEAVMDARVDLCAARGDDIEELDVGLAAYVQKRWGIELLEDGMPRFDRLKDGALVVMHNDLIVQLQKAEELNARRIDEPEPS